MNKIKVLIIGGNGMIGSELLRSLKLFNKNLEVKATLRNKLNHYDIYLIYNNKDCFFKINVFEIDNIKDLIKLYKPNVIINCVGVTKQKINDFSLDKVKYINSNFPHKLYKLCNKESIRLIHLSTDCVFSGNRGEYKFNDIADAKDIYGQTKKEGEIIHDNSLTIRKSTIGYEMNKPHGLLEWFLCQKNDVLGFKNAIFTGVSTIELSKFISHIICKHQELSGLLHLRGPKIDKYSLLKKIKYFFNLDHINLKVDEKYICDRSLNEDRLLSKLNYSIPCWDTMIKDLYKIKNIL